MTFPRVVYLVIGVWVTVCFQGWEARHCPETHSTMSDAFVFTVGWPIIILEAILLGVLYPSEKKCT